VSLQLIFLQVAIFYGDFYQKFENARKGVGGIEP